MMYHLMLQFIKNILHVSIFLDILYIYIYIYTCVRSLPLIYDVFFNITLTLIYDVPFSITTYKECCT